MSVKQQVGEVQGDADRLWPELDRLLVDAYNAGTEGDEFDILAARKILISDLAARQPGAYSPDLLAAAKDLYNETIADTTVRISCPSQEQRDRVTAAGERLRAALVNAPVHAPIPMVLHCPRCHVQHVDAPDERTPGWQNPPHRSHLCHGCGLIWRPADVPTIGVECTQTTGKNDTPFAPPAQGVDLMQLTRLSEAWLAKADNRAHSAPHVAHAIYECAKELRDSLALIDQRDARSSG